MSLLGDFEKYRDIKNKHYKIKDNENLNPTTILSLLNHDKNQFYYKILKPKVNTMILEKITEIKDIRNKKYEEIENYFKEKIYKINKILLPFILYEILGNIEDHSNGDTCYI